MALEEFDSLDEDDVDDADSEDEVDSPQTTLEPTLSRPDRASLDESSEQIEYQSEAPEPTIHSSSVPAQLGSHSAISPSLHSKSPSVTEDVRQMPDIPAVDVIIRPQSDSEGPKELKSSVVLEVHDAARPISASCPDSGPFSSPTSSSTPRKQLPTASETTPKAETLLLKDLSTDWQTDIIPATESDTVPRSDYLRLLDELDGVRQELELARRNQHVVGTAETGTSVRPCPVIATSTENARTTEFDPGLTEQLRDLANKVNEIPTNQRSDVEDITVKRASLLPPPEPGTTRLFDWSVSPNQSSSSIEPPVVEKLTESLNDEDQTPARSSSPPATLTGVNHKKYIWDYSKVSLYLCRSPGFGSTRHGFSTVFEFLTELLLVSLMFMLANITPSLLRTPSQPRKSGDGSLHRCLRPLPSAKECSELNSVVVLCLVTSGAQGEVNCFDQDVPSDTAAALRKLRFNCYCPNTTTTNAASQVSLQTNDSKPKSPQLRPEEIKKPSISSRSLEADKDRRLV
ncbi:hypothetical protein FGIG_03340 [Fasciola gigantica]|uniref:Uncharacterized protein n=1 Tax=Fasciola gigantica TaxID=46835 RepID=A0A504YTM0_FASGI|nr:hypothetical protein FGIG_03340 [Fasciola gigantica]